MPLSRFSRRHERTFGKEKEEWNGDFRKPPKPVGMKIVQLSI